MSFAPFTGHGPCPKCGSKDYQTRYHQQGWDDFEGPGDCCWEVPSWPQDERGDPASIEEETLESEEHLHRVCGTCGFEAIEDLADITQLRQGDRFVLATGIEQINSLGKQGYTVAAAWGMGVQVGAVMETPE